MVPLPVRLDKTVAGGYPLEGLNCNLSCLWCHGDFFDHQVGARAISNSEIVRALELVIAACRGATVKVSISGQGEPTLVGADELCDLIDRLRSVPQVSEVKLITNGTLLEGMVSQLRSAGLDTVTISLNSLNPRAYSLITGSGLLDSALKGIRAAVSTGLRTKVNVVYSKLNADEVLDFVRLSGSNGGIVIKFFDLLVTNPVCRELYLPLSRLQQQLEPLAVSKRTLTVPYRACEYRFDDPEAVILVKTAGGINECPNTTCKYRQKCLEGCRSSVRISQDGTLHPCGVRSDNTIAIADENASVEQVREALASGGKNGWLWTDHKSSEGGRGREGVSRGGSRIRQG